MACRSTYSLFCTLLFSAVAINQAAPQQPNRSSAPAPKELLLGPPQERAQLTREQLKTCVKQAIELAAFNSKIDQLNTKLEQERQRIKKQGDELEATKRTLNRSIPKAVDEFNARINDYNDVQKSFNASVAEHAAKDQEGRAIGQAFNIGCAGITYSKENETTVLAEFGLTENPMRLIGKARLQNAALCLDQQTIFDRANKAYIAWDYPAALRDFLALDQCGDARAQHRIGDMHYAGLGVPQNFGEARDWYLKAAKQDHAEAQFNLGVIYFGGKGVAQDYAESRKWYSKAALQGHANAQNAFAAMLHGGLGGPRNPAEAAKWFRKSAEQGFAQAQNNLGIAYATGSGVPKDFAEAAIWYRRAADQGLAQAQFHLGGLYRGGNGVPHDIAETHRWFMKAALQGDFEAQYNLGNAFERGEGIPADTVEAVNWWFKAARQGHAPAQYKMAATYLKLSAREKADRTDLVRAHMWATLAERTACAEVGALLRANAAALTSDQSVKRSVCIGAPSFRAAAAIKMTSGEAVQADRLAREWRANTGDDAPPSPQALREPVAPPQPGALRDALEPLPPLPPPPAAGARDALILGGPAVKP